LTHESRRHLHQVNSSIHHVVVNRLLHELRGMSKSRVRVGVRTDHYTTIARRLPSMNLWANTAYLDKSTLEPYSASSTVPVSLLGVCGEHGRPEYDQSFSIIEVLQRTSEKVTAISKPGEVPLEVSHVRRITKKGLPRSSHKRYSEVGIGITQWVIVLS
jgi:hypothetical protein